MNQQAAEAASPLRSFRKLREAELAQWAAVLCHQPLPSSDQWMTYKTITKEQIANLPERLRAYPTSLQRFLNSVQPAKTRAELRQLCPVHDRLNKTLARSTLGWIKSEIDINIPAVLLPLYQRDLLDHEVATYFESLKQVTGLWTSEKKYKEAWGTVVKAKWSVQEDACAACILARFASDVKAVTAFKAGLIARRLDEFRDGKPSTRLSYVNHLISHFPNSEGPAQRAELVGKHVQRAWEQHRAAEFNEHRAAFSDCWFSVPRDFERSSDIPVGLQGLRSPISLQPGSPVLDLPLSSVAVHTPVAVHPPSRLRSTQDEMSALIEQYRRTVFSPMFGQEYEAVSEYGDEEDRIATATAMNWNEQPGLQEDVPASATLFEPTQARVNPYAMDLAVDNEQRMTMRMTRFSEFL